ncbi:MAG: aldo/keto reductase, partial [Dehalococcoidia bacterium]
FSAERGHTMPELALAWLLANKSVGCVITGVSNPEQVAMNAKAADWVLTEAEKAQLDAMAPRLGDDEGQQVGARAAAAPN